MIWRRRNVFRMTICMMPLGGRRRDIDTAIMLQFTPQLRRRHGLRLAHAVIRAANPILPVVPPHNTLIAIRTVVHVAILEAAPAAILEAIRAVVSKDPVPMHDRIAIIDMVFVTNRAVSTFHLLNHVVGHFSIAVKHQGVRVFSARKHTDHRRVPNHFC